MQTFIITAKMSTMLTTTIEASSQEEADAIARGLDGSVFSEEENSGSWDIVDISQEEE